jgi:uric acid-xanthine permease
MPTGGCELSGSFPTCLVVHSDVEQRLRSDFAGRTMSDVHSTTKDQPGPVPSPSLAPAHAHTTAFRSRLSYLKHKFTTREGWFGDYDYAWLCTPALPFALPGRRQKVPGRRKTGPPFYPLDSDLPVLLALACGLQHALAMLAGLITPPIIFASSLALDAETSAYMISASLIGCGKFS